MVAAFTGCALCRTLQSPTPSMPEEWMSALLPSFFEGEDASFPPHREASGNGSMS